MTKTDELLAADLAPCPFCGAKANYREHEDEDLSTHDQVTWKTVECPNDCAQISIPDGYEGGTAIERWNTRIHDRLVSRPSTETVDNRMAEVVARSDAKFDGRDFDALGRTDRGRYLSRAAASLHALAAAIPAVPEKEATDA